MLRSLEFVFPSSPSFRSCEDAAANATAEALASSASPAVRSGAAPPAAASPTGGGDAPPSLWTARPLGDDDANAGGESGADDGGGVTEVALERAQVSRGRSSRASTRPPARTERPPT